MTSTATSRQCCDREECAGLEAPVDRIPDFGSRPARVERVEQARTRSAQHGISGAQVAHADVIVQQGPAPLRDAGQGLPVDRVEGAARDAQPDRGQRRRQGDEERQPPQRPVGPWMVGERARVTSIDREVGERCVVAGGGPEPGNVPGRLDRHGVSRCEHQPRRGLVGKRGRKTEPRRLLAVARERPPSREPQRAVGRRRHRGHRGEHRCVRLVRIGEHLRRADAVDVAGEQVGAEPDRRRPGGAAVRHRDPLDDLHTPPGGRRQAAQLHRQEQPIDPRRTQRRHHLGIEVARHVRRSCPVGDEVHDLSGHLDFVHEHCAHRAHLPACPTVFGLSNTVCMMSRRLRSNEPSSPLIDDTLTLIIRVLLSSIW